MTSAEKSWNKIWGDRDQTPRDPQGKPFVETIYPNEAATQRLTEQVRQLEARLQRLEALNATTHQARYAGRR